MDHVVFLRGANVGGHKTFKPSVLAKELAGELDVTSVGAAGTFVVRGGTSAKAVERAIRSGLGFDAVIMVCEGGEVLDLAASDAARKRRPGEKVFVGVLERAPSRSPDLPIDRPEGKTWQTRVFRVDGRFAVSLWRPIEKGRLYPNEVVERALGLAATTRTWDTIAKVAAVLRK